VAVHPTTLSGPESDLLRGSGRVPVPVAGDGNCFWASTLLQRGGPLETPSPAEIGRARRVAYDFLTTDGDATTAQWRREWRVANGMPPVLHGSAQSTQRFRSPDDRRLLRAMGRMKVNGVWQVDGGVSSAFYAAHALMGMPHCTGVLAFTRPAEEPPPFGRDGTKPYPYVCCYALRDGNGRLVVDEGMTVPRTTRDHTVDDIKERWKNDPSLAQTDVVIEFQGGSHYQVLGLALALALA
jgi:hypothetical protein